MFGQNWGDCVSDTGVATLQCIPVVFSNIITFALIASGIVALIFIIYSGFKLVTSGGDQKKVEGARKTLTWAIIGLVLILLSFFIVNIVGYVTGVDCINRFGFDNCAKVEEVDK